MSKRDIEPVKQTITPAAAPTGETVKEVEKVIDPRDEEIARLKAELESAKAEKAQPQASTVVYASDGTLKKFVVSVPDAPSWVVEAVDAANAFQAYKQAVGMISTPHEPTIALAQECCELGRYHGV